MPQCLKCEESNFEVQNVRFDFEIKKQDIEVISSCNVCKNCKSSLMNTEQMNAMRKAAADKYRELNGLLTAPQIIALREKLGMSQISFAQFLNVGVASIKRWETYYIQDESQNDHIRVKCDLSYSEANNFYLHCKYRAADIFSGLKAFSSQMVKLVNQFFGKGEAIEELLFKRLFFYTDFLHFKRHHRCITGMRYIPMKSGPSPDNYPQLVHFLKTKHVDSYKIDHFDEHEKKTVQDISNLFLRDKGQTLCNLSSQEKWFLETKETDFISYGYAKDLLI